MHEIGSVQSTDSSEPAKKASELLSDEDFFDKEEDTDTDIEKTKKKKKQHEQQVKKKKKTTPVKAKPKRVPESTSRSSESASSISDVSSSSDSDGQTAAAKEPKAKKPAVVAAVQADGSTKQTHKPFQPPSVPNKKPVAVSALKKPTSFEQYKKQLLKNKLETISGGVKKSVTVRDIFWKGSPTL